jgi:DHA2 family multidrug resistance protein
MRSALPSGRPILLAPANRMSAPAPAIRAKMPAPTTAPTRLDTRKLITFIAMVFGMFMAILDIQIVSASLAEIQAGLSASADEISWVQTSYLIAEVIMIPLSGFLSRAFSTRYTFAVSAGGFTLMSVMCANASSLNEMIVWRALQGFIGGAMIPTVFAAAFTIFPRDKQPIIAPIIGLVATLAPTIGPTVGGYLTDAFSWHWLFLVNVVPGILVTVTTWFLIDFDEPDLSLLEDFDWFGLLAMAAFLGCLEYMLEEGPGNDWFQDQSVFLAGIGGVIGGVLFFWRAFSARQPIVDLTAFADRNFWTGSLFSFVMGIGLYGLTYLYPVYLARVRGYSALQIGQTMFVTGACMFIAAPITGRLMGKVDPRMMIATGFLMFAIGTLQASAITADWDFWELLVPQMLRGFGLMLSMVPINNLALGTLPPSRLKNASGLYNLTRNFGGAVGLALINTLLNNRMDLHLQRLHEQVAWGRTAAEETLTNLTQGLSQLGSIADLAATKKLALIVRQQAMVMSLGDVFYALTFLFGALVLMAPLMRRPAQRAPQGGH